MKDSTKLKIRQLIEKVITQKINKYTAETNYVPFHEALFEKKVILQASKLHSLYTSLGMSIYEQMSKIISVEEAGYEVITSYKLEGVIDKKTELLINNFCLSTYTPKKKVEIEKIRKTVILGTPKKDDEGTVDIFVIKPNGEEVYIDITSPKLNKKEFRSLRKKMLRWCALRLSQNPTVNIRTCIGIPYNPYYPNKYERWTGQVCDPAEELLIQEDLWKEFSGGQDVFEELLEIFNEVGERLKEEISTFLNKS